MHRYSLPTAVARIISIAALCLAGTALAQDVDIPDANLRAAVEGVLGKPPGETITAAEMATLTNLNAQRAGISDLRGLEFATNLVELRLRYNAVTDLTPLANLNTLQKLDVGSNAITNLAPLHGLTGLTVLHLENNSISDFSALGGLSGLRILGLGNNAIADIGAVSGLGNLGWLNLANNAIVNLGPLTGLDRLARLFLADNAITDISPLVANAGLGDGDEVTLANNPLSQESMNVHVPTLLRRGVLLDVRPPEPEPVDAHGDSPETATDLALGGEASGEINPSSDVDYFRLNIVATTGVRVTTTFVSTAGEFAIAGVLLDATGTELASSDGTGAGGGFQIERRLEPGVYFLRLASSGNATGAYVVMTSSFAIGVDIPDPNLRAVLERQLGKQPGASITGDELATLTELNANNQGIADLRGLEFATGLTRLSLEGNAITDLTPLSDLINLSALSLRGNAVEELSPLSGLTRLRQLILDNNAIADIGAVSALGNLDWLDLAGNAIVNLGPLTSLDGLTRLLLANNEITDISPLVANVGLGEGDEVELADNPLSQESMNVHVPALLRRGVQLDVRPPEEPVDVHGDSPETATDLALGGEASGEINPSSDVDYFRLNIVATTGVRVATTFVSTAAEFAIVGALLDATGTELASSDGTGAGGGFQIEHSLEPGVYFLRLASAGNATGAYVVTASSFAIGVDIPDPALRAVLERQLGKQPGASIAGDELATLTELNANNQGIADLRGLEFATGLTRLFLEDNAITDLTPLGGLTKLTALGLSGNAIADLTPLSDLTNLSALSLRGNAVEELTPLSGLNNLNWLQLSDNAIRNLTPLSGLTRLRQLILDNNAIADISAVSALGNLDWLDLAGNAIVNLEPLTSLDGLTRLLLANNEITDISPLVANAGLGEGDEVELADNPLSQESTSVHVPALLRRGVLLDVDPSEPVDVHGDSPETATDLALGGEASGEINPSSDVDYFRLNIVATTEVRVATTFVSTADEFAIVSVLLDATGTELASSDGTGAGGGFQMERDLEPGVYFLRVASAGDATGAYVVTASSVDAGVNIPDANLRTALERQLGKQPGASITGDELATLTGLRANAQGIVDLRGLEFATGLTRLFLQDSAITDLTPLRGLTNLEVLLLTNNAIADVTPLRGLTNLTELNLGTNDIRDLAPLRDLTNLDRLLLNGNAIVDVTPLRGMTKLSRLFLHRNAIADVTPLRGMTSLEALSLQNNAIADLTPLRGGPTNLRLLYLNHNAITDVTPLRGMTNLEGLWLINNAIADVTPLRDMTNLEVLLLTNNAIADVTPLRGLTNLVDLLLDNNDIADIAPLVANAGLGKGDTVKLAGNPLSRESMNVHVPALLDRGVLLDVLPPEEPVDVHGDSPETATDLALGGEVSGEINPSSDVDYFRLNIVATTGVRVATAFVSTADEFAIVSVLLDATGTELASSDGTGAGGGFQIQRDLEPGVYFVRVASAGNATGTYVVTASGVDAGVDIPDANLRAAIERALGKRSGEPISHLDMEALSSLSAPQADIFDLHGLQFASNLRELQLRYNAIEDLTPLADLDTLRQLDIGGNAITDLTPLGNLRALTLLHLEDNFIRDFTALGELRNLTILGLGDNAITDLGPISNMGRLTWLNLAGNAIRDLTPLVGLGNLVRLFLGDNAITDISPLTGLGNLEILELNSNSILDIQPLMTNTGLDAGDEVDLRGNPLSQESTGSHIPALRGRGVHVSFAESDDSHGNTPETATDLVLGDERAGEINQRSDVDYFRLEITTATDVRIATVGDLETVGSLLNEAGDELVSSDGDGGGFLIERRLEAGVYFVRVTGTGGNAGPYVLVAAAFVADVDIPNANLRAAIEQELGGRPGEPITSTELATLTTLLADSTGATDAAHITDLTGLEFATNLTRLDLAGNAISDLSALVGLDNLVTLDLEDNAISDLSPLADLNRLTFLNLGNNAIADLAALTGLGNLAFLYLNDNLIADLGPLVANTGLGDGDELDIRNNPLSPEAIGTHLPALLDRGVRVYTTTSTDGDTPETAINLPLGSQLVGVLAPGSGPGYFRLIIEAATDVRIFTTGGLHTTGTLYSETGFAIATSNGDGGGFLIERRLDPGVYLVRVQNTGENTGPYVLNAMEGKPRSWELEAGGGTLEVELADYFPALEDALDYAVSSNSELLEVHVEDGVLIVRSSEEAQAGRLTVMVTARDSEGLITSTTTFTIALVAAPRSLLRGWRLPWAMGLPAAANE